jgi:hypothetical protein
MKGEIASDTSPQTRGLKPRWPAVTPTSHAPTTHATRKKAIVRGYSVSVSAWTSVNAYADRPWPMHVGQARRSGLAQVRQSTADRRNRR